ncbi:beta-phosphoglucomutase family hydrolase [Brevibacterium gallinarum]|uniref:Beta-phosphoglucomutase family hydrolase n=1 Tax=Brevibacterium gallinarum TaxID=2762220 RepID=A0ABR8WV12_9MICO|nr:beta-phosphoglucomutase family hydrolase [Brevibacterium gallinarum]MBD8020920.1 beta-phosphoglucomutase family hydrolase [Brevibacterium gallinarum]
MNTIVTTPWSAVIFDMDGVVTDTASLHAIAWKRLFDDVLASPEVTSGDLPLSHHIDTTPFDGVEDYRRYVDGRPREDGVRTFLNARNIFLPEGSDDDPSSAHTIHGLARRKNDYFSVLLEREGIEVFSGTVKLIERLRRGGTPIGLVTASRNAPRLLETAGIAELFDVVIDGQVARDRGLPGKPAPDTFVAAAELLGFPPRECAVLEDAVSGVQAARTGEFGLVVGIARDRNRADLEAAGADVVVTDANELDLGIVPQDPWELSFAGFEPEHEGRREALTTLANGYMSLRGAAPEAPAGHSHYPGSYMAGIFNRLWSHVNGRDLEHESLVNLPNWNVCDIRFADGDWFSAGGLAIVSGQRTLSFANGVLTRELALTDAQERELIIRQQRLVSMDRKHVAAMLTQITPVNTADPIVVRTGIDMNVINDNVREYDALSKKHLMTTFQQFAADGTLLAEVETSQSKLRIAIAQRTQIHLGEHAVRQTDEEAGVKVHPVEYPAGIFTDATIEMRQGATVGIDTTTALVNSRDDALTSVREGAVDELNWLPAIGYENLLPGHTAALQRLWERFDVEVEADSNTQLLLHLHTFHLLQSLSPHTVFADTGTPARGLHGEGYRGHIFWDELFVLPLVNLRLPEISKSLLLYRWRRLNAARHLAREAGLEGALFPWQSGSDGREETPVELFNRRAGRWMPDNSWRQKHVGLAIAYNAWQHYRATEDVGWLAEQGGELVIEITRLFASLATYDAETDRFHINDVMGPDEFHDGYPGTPGSGLRDNAYTNIMTAWVCRHAVEIFRLLPSYAAEDLIFRLNIQPAEITLWGRLAARLAVPFNADGIISQFDGYDDLEELDWAAYRKKYGNIGRMDLIMEAEGDSTNNYKLSKQADVTMLIYLLGANGLIRELGRMGYRYTMSQVEQTVDYYTARSTNGSSLSNVVNAAVLAAIGRPEAWDVWQESLVIDLHDTQWGTTQEGIHLGAMAGTVDVVVRAFVGVLIRYDRIEFRPRLPEKLTGVRFRVLFQGQVIDVRCSARELVLTSRSHETSKVKVRVWDDERLLDGGETLHFSLPEHHHEAVAMTGAIEIVGEDPQR